MESELQFRRRLQAAGYSDRELRRLLRCGELRAVRPGAYALGPPPDDAVARHLLLLRAELASLSTDVVVSHVSAALLHGLPVWAVPLDRVHVTRPRRSGGRRAGHVHVHTAPLGPAEVVDLGGIRVTTVGRTLVDLARSQPFEQAVVVADNALARELLDDAGLRAAVSGKARWPGMPAARRVLEFADARSESVGESRSRVAIARAGLPVPVLQWEVRTSSDRFVAYTDFGWPALRTVGEFDGRIKYGRLLRPGQEAGDAIYAEKLREDRLRDEGLSVVRWTWADLADFAPTAARLRKRFPT